MIKKLTLGFTLNEEDKKEISSRKGFIRFIDDEYWEEDFTYEDDRVVIKRNNYTIIDGIRVQQVPMLTYKVTEHDYEIY